MIMSYLVFKQPLPPDQIGKSLNEQMLPHDPLGQQEQQDRQEPNSKGIDEFFDKMERSYEESGSASGDDAKE